MTPIELVNLAKEARSHAYVPYSGFSVGAALLCKDGKIYQGCNIENAAFGPTVCAERTAGRAGEEITGLFPPCGVCRQVMREFCDLDFKLYLGRENGAFETMTLGEMLPMSFSPADLK